MDIKEIPILPRYYCSSHGEIYSDKGRNKTFRKLKFRPSNSGYLYFHARLPESDHHFFVHRAVALAWISNPESKREVNHKDGNKMNNIIDNLEWVTPKENQQHSMHVLGNKLGKAQIGINNGSSKLNDLQVHEIRRLCRSGMHQIEIAKMFGMTQPQISAIKRRAVWKHLP